MEINLELIVILKQTNFPIALERILFFKDQQDMRWTMGPTYGRTQLTLVSVNFTIYATSCSANYESDAGKARLTCESASPIDTSLTPGDMNGE